ncbi:MAG TPA: DUF488 domain-containing protein [Alphaproteobacteria bacterium]|jgi:uncharacterized protein (DUF488 family)
MTPTVYTIGHSNHAIAAFLALLGSSGIGRVADVRSLPYSRRWPQFRRPALEAALAAAGLDYLWLGDALGGRPRDPEQWQAGRPDYARIAAAPAFQAALDRVVAAAREKPTALMCAERDPLDCHRFHLLAPPLLARGVDIIHVMADGSRETQGEAAARQARKDRQGRLFE